MNYTCFSVEIENHIAHVRMNRGEERNTMNIDFWNELPEIVRAIDASAEARVIVLSAEGKHFTAGLDLAAFNMSGGEQNDNTPLQLRANIALMQQTFSALEECRLPVLAAIQGGCIGGGVDMVTACDMRFATEDAFFTIYEVNVGLTADVGTFPRICHLLPEGIVRELAYTGRRMPASEAFDRGLVNKVYADEKALLDGVMELAAEIASKPPMVLYGCKRMITYARDHSTADCLDYVVTWNMSMLQGGEITEAIRSGMEKRPGNFAPLPPTSDKVTAVEL